VDEWGLVGTWAALHLLRLRERQGFSIVALGDDKQCASVEAGAIIELSRLALGAEQVPEILTTRRQRTEREQTIAGLFREGGAAEALAMKRSDGTAEMAYGGYDRVVARARRALPQPAQHPRSARRPTVTRTGSGLRFVSSGAPWACSARTSVPSKRLTANGTSRCGWRGVTWSACSVQPGRHTPTDEADR
jgi:hypothetical protein